MNPGRARIDDVARQAGVSRATVDRVLNRRGKVRQTTINRVFEAVEHVRYSPDPYAQGFSRKENLRFDFILPLATSRYFESFVRELEREAVRFDRLKVTVRHHFIDAINPSALAEQLVKLAPASDGIAFVAVDHPLVREAMRHAHALDVPLVTLVTDVSQSAHRLAYVGIDNRAAGRTAGLLMARFLGAQSSGSVGLLVGSHSYRGHEEREMGFRGKLLERAAHLRVLVLNEGLDDDERSYAIVGEALRSNDDLLGVYNVGAGTPGVARALIEQSRAGEVVFIAHELTNYTREYLASGVIDAIINQNISQEINMAVQLLMNKKNNQHLMRGVEIPKVEIYLEENMP